jgi:nucleotide-binding universal stress UspA family protein
MERIVVGIDGSDTSRQALAWAVREAGTHGGRVEAVTTWHLPYPEMYPYGVAAGEDKELHERQAREVLDGVVDGTDTAGLAEPVERIVACGHPASTLVDMAKGADLLVVGSRGRGGFAGLLLGSVSTYCVHHAACPVLVVRPHED